MANWQLDMRIPVVFGAAPEAGDAVLIEGNAPAPPGFHVIRFSLPADTGHLADTGHPNGCTCCAPRGPAAEALALAFRNRATGAAPFFHRIAVLSADAAVVAAIEAALATDAVTTARYRKLS
jgi:hypothetical protein